MTEDKSSMQRLAAVGSLEIIGMDLSRPLPPEARQRILDLFGANPILVFREQNLTKEQQYNFTLNFGEIEDQHVGRHIDSVKYDAVHTVSNQDKEGNPSAALPESTQRRIEGLRAIHSWEASRRKSGSTPATEAQIQEHPPVDHPIVRTHPVRGTKSLYLGNHTSHVRGMPKDEGRKLLAELEAHATSPTFVYTHQWLQGDLVMWDNRCLLHRALTNFDMDTHARILHRTVVRGTVPV